jgi:hypothetical protein
VKNSLFQIIIRQQGEQKIVGLSSYSSNLELIIKGF